MGSDMLIYAHSRLISRFLSCSKSAKLISPQIRSIHQSVVKQNSSVVVSRTGFRPLTSNPTLNTTTTCRNMSLTTQTQFSSNFLFRQLFDRDSCTYTYLLADTDTKEAILIDPVIDLAERDAEIIKDLGLKLLYSVNTHVHADHITGTGLLKKYIPDSKSVISKVSGATADVYVQPGEKIKFGKHEVEVRATPGHTNGCVAYVCHSQGCVFTGDALLIRGCGRTDFQEGNPNTLYDSVWNQILSLPDNFKVYPAHDYKGRLNSSVIEEKTLNPRLTNPREEFIKIMENLGLPYPKKIDESLPANKVCGLYELPERFQEKFK